MRGRIHRDHGFSIFELTFVVVIIGILVAMAIPLYVSSRAQTENKACFANQRILEGAVMTWVTSGAGRSESDLTGVVDGAHPIVVNNIVGSAPTCPSASTPADPVNPTVAEGAYTFSANGTIEDCPHGPLGAHGHY